MPGQQSLITLTSGQGDSFEISESQARNVGFIDKLFYPTIPPWAPCVSATGTFCFTFSTDHLETEYVSKSDVHFEEISTRTILFPSFSTALLSKITKYLDYRDRIESDLASISSLSADDITKRLEEFHIDPEDTLDLLLASDFLDI